MLTVGLFSWWYTSGWQTFVGRVFASIKNTINYFSLGQLFKTLFQPFRQISAGAVGKGGIDAKIQAFTDRLISRIVGTFARLFIIIAGIVVIIVKFILGMVVIIAWPIIPLAPAVFVILAVAGVTF